MKCGWLCSILSWIILLYGLDHDSLSYISIGLGLWVPAWNVCMVDVGIWFVMC